MDQLLEHPGTHAFGLVAPARGSRSVRKAEEAHQGIPGLADGAGVEERLDAAPLLRQAQLVADREDPAAPPGRGDQPVALGKRRRHRLLEEHVLAALERGDPDLGVEVIRDDHVYRVDVGPVQEAAVIEVDGRVREIPAGLGGARLRPAGDGGHARVRDLLDGGGMLPSPRAVPDQAEAHRVSPSRRRPPARAPRTSAAPARAGAWGASPADRSPS